MSWQRIGTHPWHEPLAVAAAYADEDMALLYSSREEAHTGKQSYLFLEPSSTFSGQRWGEFPPLPAGESALPAYVGYLGYGLRTDSAARGAASPIDLPNFQLTRYGRLLKFDHAARQIHEYATSARTLQPLPRRDQAAMVPGISRLTSNFTRAAYEACIHRTLEQIRAGNFYQANVTRKFYGNFADTPDYFALFRQLCAASPAPYSAYIRHGAQAIISSSPESFLSIADGHITSRPIKGSAPRGRDSISDAAIRHALAASPKNRAENLMITDLMRHDLARVSQPGSVQVTEQSKLYSYETIHHLVSTITAKQRPECSVYEVVEACFPPGSMTGAPKIAAMDWCTAQEGVERGVYSGALGWFGAGSADLSVVIRTLICQGSAFEFQVGGGIVADSTPEDEWRETLVKARGIALALGISEAQLEAL